MSEILKFQPRDKQDPPATEENIAEQTDATKKRLLKQAQQRKKDNNVLVYRLKRGLPLD